ncbi:velvet factor-domain-containing protein [Phlyctochytrium arcticum]|nr:velvet factor-domain-containing protein [Phlyctochytrium arcticum]
MPPERADCEAMAKEFSAAVPTSLELQRVQRNEVVDASSRCRLIIRQQPLYGRSCGFGEKINRRPLDPCCIVQLAYLRDDNELDSRLEYLKDVTMYVAHATLWDADGLQERNIVLNPIYNHTPLPTSPFLPTSFLPTPDSSTGLLPTAPPSMSSSATSVVAPMLMDLPTPQSSTSSLQFPSLSLSSSSSSPAAGGPASASITSGPSVIDPHIGTLFGSLVSPCHFLTDLNGTKGAYFVFPDLSIRVEGTFTLKIILSNLASIKSQGVATVMASVTSNPFISYNSRDFPGLQETSALSQHFARQGVKIPVRRKPRKPSIPKPSPLNQQHRPVSSTTSNNLHELGGQDQGGYFEGRDLEMDG